MKVVFAAPLHTRGVVSTCYSRMREVERLGHSVTPVDVAVPLLWGGRLVSGACWRLKQGPGFWRVNRELVRAVEATKPDLVWVELGAWLSVRALERIRNSANPLLVHYTPDPAFVTHQSWRLDAALPLFDLLVTTKAYEVEEYKRRGARAVLLQFPSYDRDVHRPEVPSSEERGRFEADVVFVGSYAPGRETFLAPLSTGEFRLRIWGNYWQRCRDKRIRRFVEGRGVGGREYALALSCARIGLGLLSPLHPDRSTTRSLEIPACGTFLLAERTQEHQELFREGTEAEFFSGEGELVEKTRRYLRDDEARRRIAAAGLARCESGGYSSRERVRGILAELTGQRAGVGGGARPSAASLRPGTTPALGMSSSFAVTSERGASSIGFTGGARHGARW